MHQRVETGTLGLEAIDIEASSHTLQSYSEQKRKKLGEKVCKDQHFADDGVKDQKCGIL